MLRELPSWWAARMRELLPARLRAGSGRRDAVVAELDASGEKLRLLLRRRGRETVFGEIAATVDAAAWAPRLARRPRVTVLRLSPRSTEGVGVGVLVRELALPLAAERDLHGVLRYEMDRVTPFAASDVFWTVTVVSRDRAQGRLGVRLALVPRALLRPALAMLRQAGRAPSTLEVRQSDAGAGGLAIPLADAPPGSGRRQAAWTTALAAACAVLAVANVALPFARQSWALGAVERRIAALRPAVDEAEGMRRRLAAARASGDVIAAERIRLGDPLAVLAALTEILPDDTHLTELTLAQRKLGLRGQSGSGGGREGAGGAARLIGLLAADPALRNPAFSAPVVRNEAGRADLFSLRAEIAP